MFKLKNIINYSGGLFFKSDSGQMFILSLIVLTVVMVSTVTILSGSLTFFNNSKYSVESLSATNLAEAGIDKATASLNATGGTFNPNPDEEIQLGNGTFSIKVTSVDASTKKIESTGYIPNKANQKSHRTIELLISKGEGISFNYGAQIGEGGLTMQNNAFIQGSGGLSGNVYSNGNVVMSNGATITGDVFVAGGTQPIADPQTDCVSPNCLNFDFGKNISGNNILDIAQSFIPQNTAVINKVSVKLKKYGSPSNLTLRILGDVNGNPNKNDVKASGILNANLVTSSPSFIEVALTTNPILNLNTTYWIMLDTSANSSNYWAWSQDSLGSYTGGSPKWSANWNAANPVWNNISGDLGFKVYMGGVATSVIGSNNAIIGGNAHGNTLQDIRVNQDAYYQLESGITVSGANCSNNTHCHPNSVDPAPLSMPISDGNIQQWQQSAESGGITGGITGCPSSLLRKKYTGNVILTNNCIVTADSPLWITGNLELDNGSKITLNPTYGASSGVIVVDGTIKLSNNGRLEGSGTAGSYMMGLSNHDSRYDDSTAIEADNGSNSVILYANQGKIILKNNAALKEVIGWKLFLDNGASVTYETGLASTFFSSGPGGSFSVIKGTYQSK